MLIIQQPNNSLMSIMCCHMEGCPPTIVLNIDINIISPNQQPNNSLYILQLRLVLG